MKDITIFTMAQFNYKDLSARRYCLLFGIVELGTFSPNPIPQVSVASGPAIILSANILVFSPSYNNGWNWSIFLLWSYTTLRLPEWSFRFVHLEFFRPIISRNVLLNSFLPRCLVKETQLIQMMRTQFIKSLVLVSADGDLNSSFIYWDTDNLESTQSHLNTANPIRSSFVEGALVLTGFMIFPCVLREEASHFLQ